MNILSRLLQRLGYVRLRDYGYTLTSEGRIVELPRVTDDRFAPPPWEPIAWQSTSSFPPSLSAPVPRELPPPPLPSETRDAQAGVHAPETRVPVAGDDDASLGSGHDTQVRPEVEEEEWEWRMALARARERTARDTGERAVPPAIPAAAQRARRTTQSHIVPDRSAPNPDRPATLIGPGPTRSPADPRPSARVEVPRPPTRSTASLAAQPAPARSGDSGRAARGTHSLDAAGESARVAHGTQGLPVTHAVETSGRIALGTQGIEVPAATLPAAAEAGLVQAAEGMEFADGSDSHGVRAEPGDQTALDVRPAPPPDDDTDVIADDPAPRPDRAAPLAFAATAPHPAPPAPPSLAVHPQPTHAAPAHPTPAAPILAAAPPAPPTPPTFPAATAPLPVFGGGTVPHPAPPAPAAQPASPQPTPHAPAPEPVFGGAATVPHTAPPPAAPPPADNAPLPRLTARLRRPTQIR
jgi:hypothetical protein